MGSKSEAWAQANVLDEAPPDLIRANQGVEGEKERHRMFDYLSSGDVCWRRRKFAGTNENLQMGVHGRLSAIRSYLPNQKVQVVNLSFFGNFWDKCHGKQQDYEYMPHEVAPRPLGITGA